MGKKVEGKGYMYVGKSSWLGGGEQRRNENGVELSSHSVSSVECEYMI